MTLLKYKLEINAHKSLNVKGPKNNFYQGIEVKENLSNSDERISMLENKLPKKRYAREDNLDNDAERQFKHFF